MDLGQIWVNKNDREDFKRLARMKGYTVTEYFEEVVKLLKDEKLNTSQKVNLDWGN